MEQYEQKFANAYYRAAIDRQPYPPYTWPYYFNQPHPSDPNWGYNYVPNAQSAWSSPSITPQALRNEESYRERQQPLTFVLIHGAWADASFWDEIAAELRKKGHTVYAPEYPGHGTDLNKAVTHEMITKSIADFITSRNLRNVVLVGHSFGGSLVQTVAQLIPDRFKRLVFLDAFVLNDGQMLADEFPPPFREGLQQLIQPRDNTIMLPFPLFRENFVNLASLELAQHIYKKISPEPAKPFFENLDLKKFYSLNTPRSYIYLTEDNALPQGNGFGWHPHMSSRLGVYRLIKGHGDHMTTPKTEPGMLAQKIYEAGRD
jgi:pimeloyl-ACP methyl ester carboxylesterase